MGTYTCLQHPCNPTKGSYEGINLLILKIKLDRKWLRSNQFLFHSWKKFSLTIEKVITSLKKV